MVKKIILDCEEVRLAYNETSSLEKTAKKFGVSRGTIIRFMNEYNLPRNTPGVFFIDKDELQDAYSELNSTRKIAERYGVSREVIERLFSNHGIKLNQRQSSERFLPDIIRMTDEGKNNFEIAEALKVTPGHINEVARENGIKLNFRFHKGYIITHNGYKMLRKVDHPDADSKGYVREHRMVVAEKLGLDALPKSLICHHLDEDKLNNEPDNLDVMTLSEHTRLHHSSRH